MGELSSKHKHIRLGHSRRACEVNFNRGQQQEPTKSSPRKARELVGNPCALGRGGCQSNGSMITLTKILLKRETSKLITILNAVYFLISTVLTILKKTLDCFIRF